MLPDLTRFSSETLPVLLLTRFSSETLPVLVFSRLELLGLINRVNIAVDIKETLNGSVVSLL